MTTIAPVPALPDVTRTKLRTLSLGPVIAWGFWSWTFHAKAWAAVEFDDDDEPIAWAAFTPEIDELPVVGVYVRNDHRRQGLGETLLRALLEHLIRAGVIGRGSAIFASTARWSKYEPTIEDMGLRCLTWL
jgi:GNAT superfamily N-acetyltransferase